MRSERRWLRSHRTHVISGCVEQTIEFCTSIDGTRIAYAVMGDGPPLVRPATFVTHIDRDVNGPTWGHWWRELSRDHMLIRYDLRGTGLSQREVSDLSLTARVSDLEAVVDALGLGTFDIVGHSQGASVGLAYVARNPGRVGRFVVVNGVTEAPMTRHFGTDELDVARARAALMLQSWDQASTRRLWASWLIPDSTSTELNAAADLLLDCATADQVMRLHSNPAQLMSTAGYSATPNPMTLVLHSRSDEVVSVEAGRALAETIQGSRFVELDSRNHILTESEPAWRSFLTEARGFLATSSPVGWTCDFDLIGAESLGLSHREAQALALICEGASDLELAARLGIERRTASNHVKSMLRKTGAKNRAHAVAWATHERVLR